MRKRSLCLLGGVVFSLLAGHLSASGAGSSTALPPPATFITTLGWEDDVDIVVAPDREFLVLCEEKEDGAQGRVRVMDLDPATGNVVGTLLSYDLPGFENGVDPIILPELAAATGYPVLVPFESEDGTSAGVLVVLVNPALGWVHTFRIDTGALGFRPDVDGLWTHYAFQAVAFFPMESENHGIRGVLAIDVDPTVGGFAGCTIVASAPVAACAPVTVVDWLPGLADAVDAVAYEKIGICARLALPVVSRDGTNADLLLLDFDPTVEPPLYQRVTSVKGVNAALARPTNFPGFERDVDIRLFNGGCIAGPSMLVPVEGPGDVADLYFLDQDGLAIWTLSHDSGGTLHIPGFEAGVDPVPWCNVPGGGAARIAVPVENAAGTDADLWIVQLSDGHLIARVEDPLVNPGFTLAGYEIGVDPVLWTDGLLVVPIEGLATAPGMIVLSPNGTILSRSFGGAILGFRRSVDPIVDTESAPHTLYVPVAKDDGSDSNVLIGNDPPNLAGVTLENVNAGEVMGDYEWDVDLGLVDKIAPGGAFLYLPEEKPDGSDARLRIQEVPTGARLAIATRAAHAQQSSLYFVGTNPLGTILSKTSDLFGLESGLDMSDGRGQVSQDWQPNAGPTPGQDGDSDPTLAWLDEPTSGIMFHEGGMKLGLSHSNPFVLPGPIHYTLSQPGTVRIDILDASGRQFRRISEGHEVSGSHVVPWDGRSDEGKRAPSGIYFVVIRGSEGSFASKLLVVR